MKIEITGESTEIIDFLLAIQKKQELQNHLWLDEDGRNDRAVSSRQLV